MISVKILYFILKPRVFPSADTQRTESVEKMKKTQASVREKTSKGLLAKFEAAKTRGCLPPTYSSYLWDFYSKTIQKTL